MPESETPFPWGPAEERLTARINARVPHSARVWNYWTGGKDSYPADQKAGDECLALFPGMADTVRALRYFTARAVRWLAAEAGVRQFLDIGISMPQRDPVHQVAQDAAPGARVVYADNDLLALAHARALLTGPAGTIGYINADLNDPAALLGQASHLLDLTQPTAILLMSILGHIGSPGEGDDEDAWLVTGQLKAAIPPGGYIAIGEMTPHPALDDAMAAYRATGAAPYHLRAPGDVERLLDGLELVAPGLVPVSRWRPEHSPFDHPDVPAWGGIWRKA